MAGLPDITEMNINPSISSLKLNPLNSEIRLTFHVRSSRTAKNWDLNHSIVSFHRRSKIAKYRACLLTSLLEPFKRVDVQIVDAGGTEIAESEFSLFRLCVSDGGEGSSTLKCLSINRKQFRFYLQVHHCAQNAALVDTMFLHIQIITNSSTIVDTIPLFAAGHKYPYGKKQSHRLANSREVLVARGGETRFSLLQDVPNNVPLHFLANQRPLLYLS